MVHIKRDGKNWCGYIPFRNIESNHTIKLNEAIHKQWKYKFSLCGKCQEKLDKYLKTNLIVIYEK